MKSKASPLGTRSAPPAVALPGGTQGYPAPPPMEEHGGVGGKYIGNLVYGGLDGILTSFAVVSGVAGADLGTRLVSVLGLASLFADGFAMAIGAYLSTRSQQEYYQQQVKQEHWEIEHIPEIEKAELYDIYLQRGYSEEDANTLVAIQAKDPHRWVKAMLVDELGLLEEGRRPGVSALTTFIAFVMAGMAPLAVYLVGLAIAISDNVAFIGALALSALALFGLGAAKVLVTKRSAIRSGVEMLVVGGLAAGVAYGLGAALKGIAA